MRELKKPNFVKNKKLVRTTTFISVLLIAATLLLSGSVTAISIPGGTLNLNNNSTELKVNHKGTMIFSTASENGVSIDTANTQPSLPENLLLDWLHFDDGTQYNAIGLTAGGTFEEAVRFSPTELGPYAGYSITQVKVWQGSSASEPSHSINIKIYEAGSSTQPGNVIYTQAETTAAGYGFQTFDLDTAVYVAGNADIWVSIEWLNTVAGNYPAGVDNGPAIDTQGDWYYLGTWVEVQIYGLDYNNMIYAGVELLTEYEHDIGVVSVDSPVSGPAAGSFTPKVTIKNNGNNTESNVPVNMKITAYGTPVDFWCDGFESYVPGDWIFPSGWTIETTNPTGKWYMYNSSLTYSASTYPRIQESGSNGNAQDESLISPSIDCSALSAVHLQLNTFYFYAYSPDYANFTIYVSNNGGSSWNQVVQYTVTTTGARDINITTYAAGQSNVKIKFRFESPADTTLSSYCYFDNFWVGKPASWGPLGNNPPTGWTIQNYPSNPTTWNNNYWYNYSTYTSYDNNGPSTRYYYTSPYEDVNCALITPSIDCSALSTVNLYINGYYYHYAGYTHGCIEYSIDGGYTWNLAWDFTATRYHYEFDGYNDYNLPLAAHQSNVIIRFRYYHTVAEQGRYWYLGNIRVGSDRNNIIFYDSFQGKTAYSTNFKIWTPDDWVNWAWQKVDGVSAGNQWLNVVSGTSPSCTPEQGVRMAEYNSYSATSGDTARLYQITPVSVGTATTLKVGFWMYHYTSGADKLQVQADTGSGWVNVGDSINLLGTLGWSYHTVDITPVPSQIRIGFLGISAYGYNIFIDDVCIFDPGLVTEYDETKYVSINPDETKQVVFPNWIPDAWQNKENQDIIYPLYAWTELTGDENPSNDLKTKEITLSYPFLHDIAVMSINSPPERGDPAKTLPVECTLKNIGQFQECCYQTDVDIDKIQLGTEFYNESFTTTVWSPTSTKWTKVTSANAGGIAPEYRFYWSPSETGTFLLRSPAMSTVGHTNAKLSFKMMLDHDLTPYTLAFMTSTDYVNWNTVWSINPTADIPKTTVEVFLDSGDGLDSTTFYMAFAFIGYSYNLNYWYVDDVKLQDMTLIPDYSDVACTIILNPGESTDLEFDDWTPADLALRLSGSIGYIAKSTQLLPGDTNPANDVASVGFVLDYWHDVKVKDITSPSLGRSPDVFYCFNAYTSPYPSCWFESTTPGVLNVIGPNTASNYISAGTWAEGVWYASPYGTGQIYTVDPTTGIMTLIGGSGTGINGLAYDDNTGTMYGASSYNLYTIDLSTGTQTLIGTWGSSNLMIDIAIDNAGICYGHDIATDSIYTINLNTAAITLVGLTGISANYLQGMAYDKNNEVLYLAAYTTSAALYTVDVTTGHATLVGNFPASTEIDGFAIPYTSGPPGPADIEVWVPLNADESIAGIVQNAGVFVEDDLTCYADITYYPDPSDPENGTNVYSDSIGFIDLDTPLGGELPVTFDNHIFDTQGVYTLMLNIPLTADVDDFPNNNQMKLGIGVDDTKPTSTHVLSPATPDGCNGWYVSDLTVTVDAGDGTDEWQSGVKEIVYKVNGVQKTVPGAHGSFKIEDDGENIAVEYWAVDNVGNEETPHHTFTVDMDQTAPTVSLVYEVTGGNSITGYEFTFTATATDDMSLMEHVEFFFNNVYQTTVTGPGPTYQWIFVYNPIPKAFVKVVAYDMACNNDFDEIEDPTPHSNEQSLPQSVTQTLKLNLGR